MSDPTPDATDPTLAAVNMALNSAQQFPPGSLQWYAALAAAAELASAYRLTHYQPTSDADESLHALGASIRALLPATKALMQVAQAAAHVDSVLRQIKGRQLKERNAMNRKALADSLRIDNADDGAPQVAA